MRGWLTPSYGAEFSAEVERLYGLGGPEPGSTGPGSTGPGVSDRNSAAAAPPPFSPQKMYAEIVTDAVVLCPNLSVNTPGV